MSASNLTRRAALALAGALVVAPTAFAAGPVSFPLRLAYARISRRGFIHIASKEQTVWRALQTRTGALIEELLPLQPADMLGVRAPELDGGASCALVARRMAMDAGFDFVVLYATHDGKDGRGWLNLGGDGRAEGEAHVLDVAGGAPVISVMADARPRGLFGGHPERETLVALTQGIERRLQAMAAKVFAEQQSIAD